MTFDYDKVKDILVCPKCKGTLVHNGETLVCVDPEARFSYPIVDSIPRLLADEATELSVEDWSAVMQQHDRCQTTGEPLTSKS